MSSARQDALELLKARVSAIAEDAGFQTDAGKLVFFGEQPVLGEDDPDAAIALSVQDDEAGYQGENVFTRIPVDVQAIVRADVKSPWSTIEAVIADVKKAVELDHDLGGTLVPKGLTRGATRPLPREDGSAFIGAQVRYVLALTERWGAP